MAESYRHPNDTRAYIPSKEEAGYEDANQQVQAKDKTTQLPKNPVVHRGQDPELFWKDKYGNDDLLKVDIRSLYRHEHVAPENLIKGLYRTVEERKNPNQTEIFSTNELFGNMLERDELDKVSDYYQHRNGWSNRLIQGDSLLVTTSLLEREGMAGQVQCIYIDPPYGIKYGSNWQMKLDNRNVKDGSDDHLTGEPEQIKAFRDTWEYGIHSYLSYMRDRLLVAKELLTESGSCFVQISDENVHLVRCLMDEVFGSENFVSLIAFRTKSPLRQKFVGNVTDYIIWYGKDIQNLKYRQVYDYKESGVGTRYNWLELHNGGRRRITKKENKNPELVPSNARFFVAENLLSAGSTQSCIFDFVFDGRTFFPGNGRSWKTNREGMTKLLEKGRLIAPGDSLYWTNFADEYPVVEITNNWFDTQGEPNKEYVVQTAVKPIQRCILMTTDPGDLVLDPTCGSGTTAYVAEQWGRR